MALRYDDKEVVDHKHELEVDESAEDKSSIEDNDEDKSDEEDSCKDESYDYPSDNNYLEPENSRVGRKTSSHIRTKVVHAR
jgi:hypothetical protein